MSFQTLITLFGLLAAAYAILPPDRRLDIGLRLDAVNRVLIIGTVLVLHYFAYQSVLNSIGWSLNIGPWRWGFGPENTSYLVALLAGGAVLWRSRRVHLSNAKIKAFQELSERLLFEGKHSDLVFLLERLTCPPD